MKQPPKRTKIKRVARKREKTMEREGKREREEVEDEESRSGKTTSRMSQQ